ncbi:hypothetical protein ACVWYG_001497 [Pedobacter sp. UYEF25]
MRLLGSKFVFLLHKNLFRPAKKNLSFYSRWSQKVGKGKCMEPRETKIDLPKKMGGRPVKKIKKETGIRIRLTKTEDFMIREKARKAGMRVSEWCRQSAKSARITPRLSAEDLQYFRVLSGLANNLNQLTKLAHQQGILLVQKKCRELIAEIDALIKKLIKE